jgi:hypothetical protein
MTLQCPSCGTKLHVEVTSAAARAILGVLTEIVQRGKQRIEIKDLHQAYVAACNARGIDVATVSDFGKQAKAFSDAAGFQVLKSGNKVYWTGVKLVA